MSNEVKIGILAVVAIGLAIWGFTFIKGKNLFSKTNTFFVEYNDVTGLANSANVKLSGKNVGTVSDMFFKETDNRVVVVKLDINKEVKVPKDATAAIISDGLINGKVITLEFKAPCSGANCAETGSYLRGRVVGMVEGMLGGVDLTEYSGQARDLAKDVVDELTKRLKASEGGTELMGTFDEVTSTITSLKSVTAQLDVMLKKSSGNIENIMSDMESITGNLEQSNAKINTILGNTADITEKVKGIDLESTVGKVDKTLDGAENAIKDLKKTMETADKAVKNIDELITKIKDSDGSLNRLIESDDLVVELESTMDSIQDLVDDFKERPYRYMPLKSRRRVQKYDRQDGE